MEKKYDFNDLCKVMDKLLGEGGCSWDRAQTHETLREFILEECYEVIDAIDHKDSRAMAEELGDVLLQVVFHGKLGEKAESFDISDITDGITRKIINRHRHIFGTDKADTPDAVVNNWEKIKMEEKGFTTYTAEMKEVPHVLPALIRAQKVQKKASRSGMDFADYDSAAKKILEELNELNNAIIGGNEYILEEYGDLLFSVVNISRFLKINPEFALTNAIEKFINRFEYIENMSLSEGCSLEDLTEDELDRLWVWSKKR